MSFTAEAVGYPDWQRMVNWDGPVLWSIPATSVVGTLQSPIFETARYGYLGGTLQFNSGKGSVTYIWYADSAATVETGRRTLYLAAQTAQIAQLRMPNLGPWCQVTVQIQGGGPVNVQTIIAPTNRPHPLEIVPALSELVKVESSPLGSGATAVITPAYMCSGPVNVWFNAAAISMTLQLATADSSGTQQTAYQFTSTAAMDWRDKVVIPAGGYSWKVTNLGASTQNYSLVITSPGTGST